jgi:hypothetical protein
MPLQVSSGNSGRQRHFLLQAQFSQWAGTLERSVALRVSLQTLEIYISQWNRNHPVSLLYTSIHTYDASFTLKANISVSYQP